MLLGMSLSAGRFWPMALSEMEIELENLSARTGVCLDSRQTTQGVGLWHCRA
jgi:hypothetical protein